MNSLSTTVSSGDDCLSSITSEGAGLEGISDAEGLHSVGRIALSKTSISVQVSWIRNRSSVLTPVLVRSSW